MKIYFGGALMTIDEILEKYKEQKDTMQRTINFYESGISGFSHFFNVRASISLRELKIILDHCI